MYKVVIPSAGLGTRVGTYTKSFNKALISIGDLPVIARIILKFDEKVPIVIILGYKGEILKEVCLSIFPNRDIKFITVDKFEGEGSGLGYTLNYGKHLLQCPFIFIANDTIIGTDEIDLDPNLYGNWIGFYKKIDGDSFNIQDFRTIDHQKGYLQKVNPKGILSNYIYIGLCGIKDYEKFWVNMSNNSAINVGEAFGLNSIDNVKLTEIKEWYDCGNLKSLRVAKEIYKSEYNILEKESEAIWFNNKKVTKFSRDKDFINGRIKRMKFLPRNHIPQLINNGKYTYTYKKVEGEVLSSFLTPTMCVKVLNIFKKELWDKKVSKDEVMSKQIIAFYKDKTYRRVKDFFERFEIVDTQNYINDVNVPKTFEMFEEINWDNFIEKCIISHFHGDFHNENILLTRNNSFVLLDWRERFFDNNLEFGDVYYDLGKFKHGLQVNHNVVEKGGFEIKSKISDRKFISINQLSHLVDTENEFNKWLEKNKYDLGHVNLINALIFLNICALHEYPYSIFLYEWGRLKLIEVINEGFKNEN